MTKRLTFLLFFIAMLLTACTSGENLANDINVANNNNAPNNNNTANNENNTGNINNNAAANESSLDDQEEPSNVPAQCTAQSAKSEDIARPGDWIKGATENYAVTLVEYGDFQ